MVMQYKQRVIGDKYSLDYKVYLEDAEKGQVISPFHDIPLWVDEAAGVVNVIVEIPRWTNAKLEIATKEFMNPIVQDTKKGKLRFVKNCFPHHGYIWNYGAIPQTWEDPGHVDADTGCKGDDDPVDVIEIGEAVAPAPGTVKQCKVLGVLAMLDEGETDWKVIAIDVNDPLASKLNDIGDVETFCPGLLAATVEWFKVYKVPDGKPLNKFAFDGQAKDKAFACKVLKQTHEQWKNIALKADQSSGLSAANVTLSESPYVVTKTAEAYQALPSAGAGGEQPLPSSVHKNYFIKDGSVANL